MSDDGVIEQLTRDYCAVLGSGVVIGSGSIAGKVVTLFKNVRDIDQDASKTYVESFLCDENHLSSLGAPLEVVKMACHDVSPSGKTISLKYGKDEIPLVEVRSPNGSHLINVSDIHGKFVSDNWFSDGVSWSSDEKYVIYIAQTKEKKKYTFFHEESTSSNTPSSVSDQPMKGSKYSYVEDWGEKYVNTSSTCIVMVDVISGVVKLIPLLDMDDYTVGQAQFVPNTSRITFTAWSNSPRKLGMIYCYHRKCSIYITDDTSNILSAVTSGNKVPCKNLTSSFALARSPRFNKTGDYLSFLGNKSGYVSHNGTQTLYYIHGRGDAAGNSFSYDDEPVEVLPIVNTPADPSAFPGIYSNNIPKNGFVSDDEIVLNSVWGSVDSIILVSLSSKSVTRLSLEITKKLSLHNPSEWNNAADYSVQLLDANDGKILFTYSSPSMTQQFGVYDRVNNLVIPSINVNSFCIKWKLPGKSVDCTRLRSLKESVQSIRWKIFNFKDEKGIPYDGVLILPPASSTTQPLPGIIVPHGGPHSNFSSSFIAGYAYLVLTLNVAVVYINYRGSTGFGQDSINSLLGNIGTNDVQDTKHITDFFIDEGFLDRHRIGIVGGSHGGFLGAHMIGQFPSIYKVAALRNPVTNIPQMVGTTDIPDWCYVEAGLTYNFTAANLPSLTDIERMHMVSPVSHINNVTAPVLLCLGAKDRRVPYTQGLEYAQLLKAKGVKVSMQVFPEDCHALDKPTSEADQWVAIALHLHTYI